MEHSQDVTSSNAQLHTPDDPLSLADWRRRVFRMYWNIRDQEKDKQIDTWKYFLNERNSLFKSHVQSPLDNEQKEKFVNGLDFFEYNPKFRVMAKLVPSKKETFSIRLPADGDFNFTRIGKLEFRLLEQPLQLSLFWVNGYGGGLFLPFRDKTCTNQSYGGGRYLYDAIKGSDLGGDFEKNEVVLDFNYAYNPSCAYNSHYVCPLSPFENKLSVAIEAGEKAYAHQK